MVTHVVILLVLRLYLCVHARLGTYVYILSAFFLHTLYDSTATYNITIIQLLINIQIISMCALLYIKCTFTLYFFNRGQTTTHNITIITFISTFIY
jgi:hypothetical protein